jgi:hypothetical protein
MAMLENPWRNILTEGDGGPVAAVLGQQVAAPAPYDLDPDAWRNPLDDTVAAAAQAWNDAARAFYQRHVWPHEDAAGQERSPLPATPSPGELHNRHQ